MFYHRRLFCLVIFGVLVLTGCSGKVKNVNQMPGFDYETMKEEPWAIGGLVLNPKLVLDGVAEKEVRELGSGWDAFPDAHSALLYGGFLEKEPMLQIWPYGTVVDQIPAAQLEDLSVDFALKNDLKPDQLLSLGKTLEPVRYLVMARLDDTRFETNVDAYTQAADQAEKYDRDPHAHTTATGTLSNQKRYVNMSMKVFDLKTGRLVWSAEVEKSDSKLLGSDVEKNEGVQVEDGEAEGDPKRINMEGTPLLAPGLDKAMAEGCRALVGGLVPEEE